MVGPLEENPVNQPARAIISLNEMESLTPPDVKSWLKHYKVEHPLLPYPAEIVARTNGQYTAHKVVLIFIPPELTTWIKERDEISLGMLFHQLRAVKDDAKMLLIEQVRPVSFFAYEDEGEETALKSNRQLELPGGQAPGKKGFEAALQEAAEEVGLDAKQVLCWARQFFMPIANDAGTHAERYQMWYVLCVGEPRPSTDEEQVARHEEGIVKHYLIDLLDLPELIDRSERIEGTLVEIWVHMADLRLYMGLYPRHRR